MNQQQKSFVHLFHQNLLDNRVQTPFLLYMLIFFLYFFIVFQYNDLILFMGAGNPSQKQSQAQHQVIEQNYANNIMLMVFSTLETISRRILDKDDGNSSKKKFGKQDKVNYSTKSMPELISQFKTHLYLFKVSKQAMEIQFSRNGEFVFPKNFEKQSVLKEISTFKKICERSKDQILISFCDDFKKIVEGSYTNLNFQKADLKQGSSEHEKMTPKETLIKNGISATAIMNELRDDVAKSGITNPSDLKVDLNKPDFQYEEEASRKNQLKK